MQILTMIKNQLKLLFNNRIAVFAVIVLPIILTYLLSHIGSSSKFSLYIADTDNSAYSKELISMLKSHNDINLINTSENEIKQKVDDSSIPVGFVINKNLNLKMIENYQSQESAVLQEIVLSDTNTLKKAAADSKSISDSLNISESDVSKDLFRQLKTKSNISVADKTPVKNDNSTTKSLIGFLTMFIWFVIIQGFRTLIEEKSNNTFNRILSTPVSCSKYLLSKIVSTYVFSLITLGLTLAAAKYAFNISFAKDMPGEVIIFAVYLFALTGIVMLFVPFIKKQQTFTILGSVLMALTGMLGGSFFPLDEVSSKVILSLSKFTPESWAINSISDITFNNASMKSEITSITILAAMGLACLMISYALLNIKVKTEKA